MPRTAIWFSAFAVAVISVGCGGGGTSTSRSTAAAVPTKGQSVPALKTGRSRVTAVAIADLRRCPPGTRDGRRHPVGGDWSARVGGIGCRAAGHFIFDRFLDSGLEPELVTTGDQHVSLGHVDCDTHPQPDGWRVRCVRSDERFTFLLSP